MIFAVLESSNSKMLYQTLSLFHNLWQCPTWQSFGPFDHFNQLPLSQFIQAGQQGGRWVRLAVIVSRVHHLRLNGLQDVEEDHLGVEGEVGLWRSIVDDL